MDRLGVTDAERVIRLRDEHGSYLVGRGTAADVRRVVHEQLKQARAVVIDLAGVEVMAPSFADELFGRLLLDLGTQMFRQRMRVVNASPEVGDWIGHALARRARESGTAD